MKTTKLITAALLATLALAACNNDDAPKSEQVDIRTTICANNDITNADIGTRATIAPDGSGLSDTDTVLSFFPIFVFEQSLINCF